MKVKGKDLCAYYQKSMPAMAQTPKLNLLTEYAKSKITYKIVYEWQAAMARFKITETAK
ncbi:cytidine deaminase-like fold-containing protein [Snodgrassella gandavensis]|uniref:cytidine deaminase-like fold-containing protein n=1 Tax=Snodgrassella gandavensis TaxID=2946698 RepID=UPI001EF7026E|nr:hypothetical protein [Snodgrassella gandavensis]